MPGTLHCEYDIGIRNQRNGHNAKISYEYFQTALFLFWAYVIL